jgi:hypothetical protein
MSADYAQITKEDKTLTIDQLEDKYIDTHPVFTRQAWVTSIVECETMEPNYWKWVQTKLRQT